MRLAPVDGTSLYAAKIAALVIYLVILELIAVPVFGVFFLDEWSGLGPLCAVLALLDAGLAVIGVLVSSIAVSSRARDLLGPLILLPLSVPLMIAAAGAGAGGGSAAKSPRAMAPASRPATPHSASAAATAAGGVSPPPAYRR